MPDNLSLTVGEPLLRTRRIPEHAHLEPFRLGVAPDHVPHAEQHGVAGDHGDATAEAVDPAGQELAGGAWLFGRLLLGLARHVEDQVAAHARLARSGPGVALDRGQLREPILHAVVADRVDGQAGCVEVGSDGYGAEYWVQASFLRGAVGSSGAGVEVGERKRTGRREPAGCRWGPLH